MPVIPTISPRIGVGTLDLPRVHPQTQQWEALSGLADTVMRINEADDTLEARRVVSETGTKIAGAIEANNAQISDPEEFVKTTQADVQQIYDNALSTTSGRVRGMAAANLADNLQRANNAIVIGQFKKKKDRALSNFDNNEAGYVDKASSLNPEMQKQAYEDYGKDLALLQHAGFIDDQERRKRADQFHKKALTADWNKELDADASGALLKLNTGYYSDLDPTGDKQRQMKSQANSAITSAITMHDREQKVKEEAFDRDMQGLIDSGASSDVLSAKLRQGSAAGVLDRTGRKFWDERVIKGEVSDTPGQISNAETFKGELLAAYPNGGRVREYRSRMDAMYRTGEIGDKGRSDIGNILIRLEGHVNSEGRALESHARAMERQDKPEKMTSAAAVTLIGRNFPTSNPNRPIIQGHKTDVQEFITRSELGGEDRGAVAKEIYERRRTQIDKDKTRIQQRGEAADKDPPTRAILDRLPLLKPK